MVKIVVSRVYTWFAVNLCVQWIKGPTRTQCAGEISSIEEIFFILERLKHFRQNVPTAATTFSLLTYAARAEIIQLSLEYELGKTHLICEWKDHAYIRLIPKS